MATREQLIQEDMKRLHSMGYAQELFRAMGGFSNFAISFTIISILSGCLTSFFLGIGWAGPASASLGWPIVILLGFLLAQHTITGFDASAHMSEETIGADTRAPWGIVMSVVVSAIAGYALLMALVTAIPSIPAASDVARFNALAGNTNAVGQVLNSALGARLGTFLLALAVVAQFYCGMSSVTSNSRMIYAFSRDGALPFSRLWHSLHKSTRTPVNAIIIGAVLSWALALPSLWSAVAYGAATSIAVIGLFVAYSIPVYLRWRAGSDFKVGSWHLGTWSAPINVIAMAWVAFITILFMLPTYTPVTWSTLNYTPIVVLGVTALLVCWYMLSVRYWFTGPRIQGNAAEMAQIEESLGEGVQIVPA